MSEALAKNSEAQAVADRSGVERRKATDQNYSGPERRGIVDRRVENNKQFSTFYIGDRLYGIDVMKVQEVTKAMPMTEVPLAPKYVHGLINLRGQIATAVALRDLFKINEEIPKEQMNVVCRIDGLLLSILVDRIGDVMEVGDSFFEPSPNTVPGEIKRFMRGVYKIPGTLLSILEIGKISESIQNQDV